MQIHKLCETKGNVLRSSGFYDIDNKDYAGNELIYEEVDDNILTKVFTTLHKHNVKRTGQRKAFVHI